MSKIKFILIVVLSSLFLSSIICGPIILWSNYSFKKENEKRNQEIELLLKNATRELQLTYAVYKREETLAINALERAVEELKEK